MATEIVFSTVDPLYVFERDCLAFRAEVDGQRVVTCYVTLELLIQDFGARGASEEEMRDAFTAHRQEIEELARQQIEAGWIDEDNRVFLTTHHTRVTHLSLGNVANDEKIRAAHRTLMEIVGPNAGELHIDWDLVPERQEGVARRFIIRLEDPVIRRQLTSGFPEEALDNPPFFRYMLARVWGNLLGSPPTMLFG